MLPMVVSDVKCGFAREPVNHLVLRAGSDRFRLVVSAVVMAFPPPPEFVTRSFTPRHYGTSVGETPVEELEDRWKAVDSSENKPP